MNDTLINHFLAQECTPHVLRLLEEAINDVSNPQPHFEFNRFEVTIFRNDNLVVLEDVLDATDAGRQQVPLSEFAKALRPN